MMAGSGCINEETEKQLLQERGVMRRILVKSITTAKGKTENCAAGRQEVL